MAGLVMGRPRNCLRVRAIRGSVAHTRAQYLFARFARNARYARMWQRIVHELGEIKRDILGSVPASVAAQRRSSHSSDEMAIPMGVSSSSEGDSPLLTQRQTQEDANEAFVRGYRAYLEAHYGRPWSGNLGELYCCMAPQGGCWWLPLGHPLVPLFRNSGLPTMGKAGRLVAYANQDVEPAMLEIAKWCSESDEP